MTETGAKAKPGRQIGKSLGPVALGVALGAALTLGAQEVLPPEGEVLGGLIDGAGSDATRAEAPPAPAIAASPTRPLPALTSPPPPATLGAHADIIRPAAVIAITAAPTVDIRTVPGTLHPARTSRLAFRVGGPLIDLPVQEGDQVEAGTVLARIDPRDFRLTLADLQARLDAARAIQRLAEINHQRRAQLVERGHVSVAELDEAVAERDRATAEIASLTQQIATAEAALEDTELVAPFAGRIARLHVELQDYVTARSPAITFHDASAMELVVDLPERLVLRLADMHGIDVALSDQPDRIFRAELVELASEQAPETGTYRARLRLQALGGVIPLAGLSGTARFAFANGPFPHGEPANGEPRPGPTVLVPSSAVFSGPSADGAADGGDFVWRVVAGVGDQPTVTRHPVTIGGMVGDRARVTSGLVEGDRIVAFGVDFLREGQRIRPLNERLQMVDRP